MPVFHANTIGRGIVLRSPDAAGEGGDGLVLSQDGTSLALEPVREFARFAVEASTVIVPGDLLFLDGATARPASEFPYDTDDATTQFAFATVFLGVAMEGSDPDETDPILVCLDPGVWFTVPCNPSSYNVGDLLGVRIVDQVLQSAVDPVATTARAFGRVHSVGAGTVTELQAKFSSVYSCGSSNIQSLLGGTIVQSFPTFWTTFQGGISSPGTGSGSEHFGAGSDAAAFSVAVGWNAKATGDRSVSIGASAQATHADSIAIGRSATTTASGQMVINNGNTRILDIYFGNGVQSAAAPVTYTLNATGASGTNGSASHLRLAGGRGKGTGIGGNVTLAVALPGSSGSVSNSLVDKITVRGSDGLIVMDIPTSDPAVAGALWNDAGTLKVSAG